MFIGEKCDGQAFRVRRRFLPLPQEERFPAAMRHMLSRNVFEYPQN
jgi:hypothetical protein